VSHLCSVSENSIAVSSKHCWLVCIYNPPKTFAWHPESLCGVSRNQLTSTVNGENPGSRPRWSMHTSWTTPQCDNRALLSLDNSGLSWTVSAPEKVTAVPVRRNGNFPVVRPKRCHTVSCPQTRLHGGLSKLHSADDAVAWLTSCGS